MQISGMACVGHSSRFSRKVHQDQQDAEETPITHSRDSKYLSKDKKYKQIFKYSFRQRSVGPPRV